MIREAFRKSVRSEIVKQIPRRWLLATCICMLLLFAAILVFRPSREEHYLAETKIMVRPYTNALLTKQFEATIIQSIPSVIRLKVTAGMAARPGSGVPSVTNSAVIRIVVGGVTGPDAERLADQAAISLCSTTRQSFAAEATIVQKANRARPYSFFHDGIKPGFNRLFE